MERSGNSIRHAGVDIRLVLVTPEIAADYKSYNLANRRNSLKVSGQYAGDMALGEWLFTGDSLKFCTHPDGVIEFIDGQHRADAVMRSGKAQYFVVVTGLDPRVKLVLDQGHKRSVADMCTMAGIPNGMKLQAAARWLWAIKHGGYTVLKQGFSTREAFALVTKHPRLADSLVHTGQCAQMRPSLLGALHYTAAQLMEEQKRADRFLRVFQSGAPAYKDDPAHAFFMMQVRAFQTRSLSFTRSQILRGYTAAWNAHAAGQKISAKDFQIPDSDLPMAGLDSNAI